MITLGGHVAITARPWPKPGLIEHQIRLRFSRRQTRRARRAAQQGGRTTPACRFCTDECRRLEVARPAGRGRALPESFMSTCDASFLFLFHREEVDRCSSPDRTVQSWDVKKIAPRSPLAGVPRGLTRSRAHKRSPTDSCVQVRDPANQETACQVQERVSCNCRVLGRMSGANRCCSRRAGPRSARQDCIEESRALPP